MAALSANKTGLKFKDVGGTSLAGTRSVPVYATADTLYANAAIGMNPFSGKASPIGTGNWFSYYAGLSTQEVAYGASSGLRHPVSTGPGLVIESVNVAGAAGVYDKGKTVYLSTDNYADMTLTWTVSAVPVGKVHEYVSSNTADVYLFTPEEAQVAAGLQTDGSWIKKLLAVTLSAESTGDVTGGTNIVTAGGVFSIDKFWAIVTTPTSDSDADATFNLEINTTNLTGGVITLGDTGDQTTPAATDSGRAAVPGARIDSSAITAANTTAAADTISVECAVSNAYSNGAIDLYVQVSG